MASWPGTTRGPGSLAAVMMGERHAARPGPARPPTGCSAYNRHARRALAGLLLGFVALLMPHPAAAAPAPGPGVPATAAAGHTAPPAATTSRGARIPVGPLVDEQSEDHGDAGHAEAAAVAVLPSGDHLLPPSHAPPAVLPGALGVHAPTATTAGSPASPAAPAGGPARETAGRSPPASGTS